MSNSTPWKVWVNRSVSRTQLLWEHEQTTSPYDCLLAACWLIAAEPAELQQRGRRIARRVPARAQRMPRFISLWCGDAVDRCDILVSSCEKSFLLGIWCCFYSTKAMAEFSHGKMSPAEAKRTRITMFSCFFYELLWIMMIYIVKLQNLNIRYLVIHFFCRKKHITVYYCIHVTLIKEGIPLLSLQGVH